MMSPESRSELHAIVERIQSLITMDESEDSGNARSFDVIEDHVRHTRQKIDEAYEHIEHLETELSVLRKELLP